MKNRRFPAACLSVVVAVLLASPAATAPQQEPIDLEMVAKIREEGLDRSQVWATFSASALPPSLSQASRATAANDARNAHWRDARNARWRDARNARWCGRRGTRAE